MSTGIIDQALDYTANVFGAAIRTDSGTKSMTSSGSSSTIATLDGTLPAGAWIITCNLSFPSASTGARYGYMMSDNVVIADNRVAAVSGAGTNLCLTGFVKSSTATSVTLYGFQNSGSTLSVSYSYRALRVG